MTESHGRIGERGLPSAAWLAKRVRVLGVLATVHFRVFVNRVRA